MMNPDSRPEWLRPKDVPNYFGIGRSKTYELIASGMVKSVSLRKRGQKHGTRLVSYDSLAAYFESLAEGGDALKPESPDVHIGKTDVGDIGRSGSAARSSSLTFGRNTSLAG